MQATVQLEGVFSREVTFRSILSNFTGIFFFLLTVVNSMEEKLS